MKKIFIAFMIVVSIWSCNRSQNASKTTDANQPTVAIKENNAKDQFHYQGTYFGIIPCADCEGIETTIHINNDGTYVKKAKYLGKGDRNVKEVTGKFSWDDTGFIIILEGITDSPNKYYVSEGILTQLDMDGNIITGDLSHNYLLRKTI